MKVYVDADACPVKDEIIATALKHQISVVFIQSYSHFSHKEHPPGIETIYVDPGFDSADFRIIQMAKQGDIIVTQDYGLAALGLPKGCKVLNHKGLVYSEKNIDQLLQNRYLSAKARRSGQRTKGPSAFTEEDRRKFTKVLEKIMIQNKKGMK